MGSIGSLSIIIGTGHSDYTNIWPLTCELPAGLPALIPAAGINLVPFTSGTLVAPAYTGPLTPPPPGAGTAFNTSTVNTASINNNIDILRTLVLESGVTGALVHEGVG